MAMLPNLRSGKQRIQMMIQSFRKPFALLSLSFLLLFIGYQSLAGQSPAPEKKWNFLTDVYLMFPYMDGETGIGESLILPVDANPGDIFSNLKMGAMLYLEAQTDKWAITSDLVYMNLKQDVTPGTIVTFRKRKCKTVNLGSSRPLPDHTFPGGRCRRPFELP